MVQCEALAGQRRERSQEGSADWQKTKGSRDGALPELTLRVQWREQARSGRWVLESECRILVFEHGRQCWIIIQTRAFKFGTQRVLC